MKISHFLSGRAGFICAAVASLATCRIANATLTFTSSTTGGALAGVTYANFDTVPLGDNSGIVESSGSPGLSLQFIPSGQAVTGAMSGVYAAPYLTGANGTYFGNSYNPVLGTADSTTYLSAGTGEAILKFSSSQNYLGLLWGSVDTYNTLSLYSGGTLVGQLTGSEVIADANGNQVAGGTTYVNITGLTFDKVIATSTQYAFEFDNVAYRAAVPEPATVLAGMLLLLPLCASVFRIIRNRKLAAV